MAEFVSGIRPGSPAYPVKPTQPPRKDREPGEERKKRREPVDIPKQIDGDDLNDKPGIDERV